MGHLSTSERVCSKTPIPGDASPPPLLARRAKLANGDAQQQVRRGEDSSPELPPRGKLSLPQKEDTAKKVVPQSIVNHVPKDQINLEEYKRTFIGDNVLGWQFEAPLKWDKVIQISLLHIVAVGVLLTYPLHRLNWYSVFWGKYRAE